MKRMLFNATQAEELRVAIVDGQKLIDLDIESATKEQRKSNVYKGVITRIEPSLEAAFVDYGAERHGFLSFKEISRSYFQPGVEVGRTSIKEALKEGQELIVQVDKDERGNKGAALTTYVSLAGRYLVLMPNNPRGGGVSRRVDGDERAELRDAMDQLEVPAGMSLIARTAAIGRQVEELQWDLNYLLQLWRAIEGAAKEEQGPFLIYLESSLVIRAIRDYFQPEIGEILIDTEEVYEQARAFMATVMPGNVNRVKLYRDDVPLFSRFQIEHQIETAFGRQVNLPSGGAIVIDHTEALVAVDVNSGRATKGADIEETALKTNLEAADELARQLRLRDLGGLIVIDFIDMESQRNQREVESRLKDALKFDRARVQMGKISRFGLLELSRQRLRPALAETSYIPCPRCTGTGHIRSTESAALHILRILEEEAMKDNTAAVHVQVPVDVGTFLLNEKRADIQTIEQRHRVTILLIPNIHLETPAHDIQRLRHDDLNGDDGREPSYKMVDVPADEESKPGHGKKQEPPKPRQEAAIKNITPEQPAPIVDNKRPVSDTGDQYPGLITRIFSWFRGQKEAPVTPPPAPERKAREPQRRDRYDSRNGNRNHGNGRNEGRNTRRSEEREEEKPQQGRNEGRSDAQNNSRTDSRENRTEQKGDARSTARTTRDNRGEAREEKPAQETGRERRPRKERTPAPAAVAPAAPSAVTALVPVSAIDLPEPKETRTGGQVLEGENTLAETPVTTGEEGTPRRRNRRNRGRNRNGAESVGPEAQLDATATADAQASETQMQESESVQPATNPAKVQQPQETQPLFAPQAAQPQVLETASAIPAPVVTVSIAEPAVSATTLPTAEKMPADHENSADVGTTTAVEALPPSAIPMAEPEKPAAIAPAVTEPLTVPVVETSAENVQPAAVVESIPTDSIAVTSPISPLEPEVPAEASPTPVLPTADSVAGLEKDLEASGLVMIQTTAAIVPVTAETPVRLGRPRRSRPEGDQKQEEPLVMVETR